MSDVKAIYNNTFKLYNAYQNEELFRDIIKYLFTTEPDKVPLILTDTYNFYKKWVDAYSEQAAQKMVAEAKELSRKYGDNDLVRHITVNLCTIIEQGGK